MNRTSCSLNSASCNLAQLLYWHLFFFKGLRIFVSSVYSETEMLDINQSGKTDCVPYTQLGKNLTCELSGYRFKYQEADWIFQNTQNLKHLVLAEYFTKSRF